MSWPGALFLVIAGLWMLRTARYDDGQWGHLTSNWPVPWPLMSDRHRRGVRLVAAVAGTALAGAGAVLLVLGRQAP